MKNVMGSCETRTTNNLKTGSVAMYIGTNNQ